MSESGTLGAWVMGFSFGADVVGDLVSHTAMGQGLRLANDREIDEHGTEQPFSDRCEMDGSSVNDPVVILGAARTPLGAFQGGFSGVSATELGSVAIKAALDRAGVAADRVDEVLMGNVLAAGLGQAPARQASKRAGVPDAAPCTTISKVGGDRRP